MNGMRVTTLNHSPRPLGRLARPAKTPHKVQRQGARTTLGDSFLIPLVSVTSSNRGHLALVGHGMDVKHTPEARRYHRRTVHHVQKLHSHLEFGRRPQRIFSTTKSLTCDHACQVDLIDCVHALRSSQQNEVALNSSSERNRHDDKSWFPAPL